MVERDVIGHLKFMSGDMLTNEDKTNKQNNQLGKLIIFLWNTSMVEKNWKTVLSPYLADSFVWVLLLYISSVLHKGFLDTFCEFINIPYPVF